MRSTLTESIPSIARRSASGSRLAAGKPSSAAAIAVTVATISSPASSLPGAVIIRSVPRERAGQGGDLLLAEREPFPHVGEREGLVAGGRRGAHLSVLVQHLRRRAVQPLPVPVRVEPGDADIGAADGQRGDEALPHGDGERGLPVAQHDQVAHRLVADRAHEAAVHDARVGLELAPQAEPGAHPVRMRLENQLEAARIVRRAAEAPVVRQDRPGKVDGAHERTASRLARRRTLPLLVRGIARGGTSRTVTAVRPSSAATRCRSRAASSSAPAATRSVSAISTICAVPSPPAGPATATQLPRNTPGTSLAISSTSCG